MDSFKHHLVALGGTFDRLHKGHRVVISKSLDLGEKVLIGLTSDEYANSKSKLKTPSFAKASAGKQKSEFHIPHSKFKIQKYSDRKVQLESFLREKGWINRVKIVKINDVYGGADKNRDLEAIVVTDDSAGGAELINKVRKKRGLRPLEIIDVGLVTAEDGQPISSTRIRQGEIDRQGRVYADIKIISPIAETLRLELKKPIGKLIGNTTDKLEIIGNKLQLIVERSKPAMLITVGDEVTKLANQLGLAPDLAIFDFLVKRVRKYENIQELGFEGQEFSHKQNFLAPQLATDHLVKYPSKKSKGISSSNLLEPSSKCDLRKFYLFQKVINPSGHITKGLIKEISIAVREYCKSGERTLIKIEGEDDLAGVPAILLAPLESIVLYGQPGEGVVLVEVTEEQKEKLVGQITINI